MNKILNFNPETREKTDHLRITNVEGDYKNIPLDEQVHILNKCRNLLQMEAETLCVQLKTNEINLNLFNKKFKKKNRDILAINNLMNRLRKEKNDTRN